MTVRIESSSHAGHTTAKGAARLIARGVARWIAPGRVLRMIESDHRVQPAELRALYDAGSLSMARPDELRGIPLVGDVMRVYRRAS